MKETRPVWAEVNLDNVAHNVKVVKHLVSKQTQIMAVIKADGYGHGASQIAQTLLDNGADCFAVATLSEAIRLRKDFADTPILILGYTPSDLAADLVKYQLTQTIYDVDQAEQFDAYAKSVDGEISVHLKIDTGMSRLGFMWNDQSNQILRCFEFENLAIEGAYTHFAKADESDKTFTHLQAKRYLDTIDAIEGAGHSIAIKHVSNSAAIIDLPEYNFDMVRAGIMLYGLHPSPEVKQIDLREVMSLRARVSHVKTLPADVGVSYGHAYYTPAEVVIASLPLGYADGFTRMLSGKTDLLYKGERMPIVGRICMDQCMAESHLPIAKGDIVTLFGADGDAFKSIDEVAAALGTINYEIVCMIGKRVPRRYISAGQTVATYDMLLRC